MNVEPTPTWLLTQILPPWSSTNSTQGQPQPRSSCFVADPDLTKLLETASCSSGAMPTPVSLTETSTNPSRYRADVVRPA